MFGMKTKGSRLMVVVAVAGLSVVSMGMSAFGAVDEAHKKKGEVALAKAVAFLKSKQEADGSWSAKPGPAITALVVRGIAGQGPEGKKDPAAEKGLAYILSKAEPEKVEEGKKAVSKNGGIHGGMLENYNTAICLSALAKFADRPEVKAKIGPAQDYLRALQWHNQPDPQGKEITEAHPYYGGAGYGRSGRPDMSNVQMMLDGLKESGLPAEDPAFKRAIVFISRCQATDANTAPWKSQMSNDGGFVYTTSESKDKIGVAQSMAGDESVDGSDKIEGGLKDSPATQPKTQLRSYGSVTYAGWKSYAYAKLDKKDPRVIAAKEWIGKHYTLEQNPGFVDNPKTESDERMSGYYYYLMTFARAFEAWEEATVTLADKSERNWANDLVDKLVAIQKEDGSWVNTQDRFMEGDAVLTTAYSVIALECALGK
jgi:squalene-hopene/tetraprenyl-beta-curcumene cyclase